jgi:hypothetical protein
MPVGYINNSSLKNEDNIDKGIDMADFLFLLLLIGSIGLIRIQKRLHKRGLLKENSFAGFQALYGCLLIEIGFLAFSKTYTRTIIGSTLSLLCLTLGIPLARWIYRRHFVFSNQ